MTHSIPFNYITGGTVPAGSPTYIERTADLQLLEALSMSEFCYVLDTRQVGKSSLMVRAAARLRESGAAVAVLDLTAFGQNTTAEQWYYGLLLELGNQIELREELQAFWRANREIGPLQRWMEAVRTVALQPATADGQAPSTQYQTPSSLVIFIDEIDAVLGLPFNTDEFFAAIRSCYTRRAEDPEMERLVFCLLGSATPDSLIRNVRTTPFNVGKRIELTDFTREEAAPLAAGLSFLTPNTQHPTPNSQRLLDRILYWTGGHPYLTQRLCAAAAADGAITSPSGIDRLCENMFFTRKARESESNLSFVGSRLLRSGEDVAALLDLYTQVRGRKGVREDPSNPLHAALKLSGLARTVEGSLLVRNRIYIRAFDRDWVTTNMPDAELKRQRAAARRATARTAAIAGNIAAAMLGLAIFGFVQARIAKRMERKATVQATELAQRVYDDVISGVSAAIDSGNSARAFESLNETFGERYDSMRSFEWGLAANQLLDATKVVPISSDSLDDVAWAPSGNSVAVGASQGKGLKICSAASLKLIKTLPGIDYKHGLFYTRSGDLLCAAGVKTATMLTPLGQRVSTVNYADGDLPICFTWDGTRLLIGLKSGALAIVPVQGGAVTPLKSRAKGALLCAAALADGSVRSIRQDGAKLTTLVNWLAGREQVHAISVPRAIQGGCIYGSMSRTGEKVVLCFPDQALLFDGHTGDLMAGVDTDRKDVMDVSFSPDGSRAALSNLSNNLIHVIDTRTGIRLSDLHGMTRATEQTAWSPDGSRLISVGDDGFVRLWDPRGGASKLRISRTSEILSVRFIPNSHRLFFACGEGPDEIMNLDSGKIELEFKHYEGPIRHVAISRDASTLLGANKVLTIWDARKGKFIRTIDTPTQMPNAGVMSVALADDDQLVLYSINDGTYHGNIFARSLKSGAVAWQTEVNTSAFIVASADGKMAACLPFSTDIANPEVTLLDPVRGKSVGTLKGHLVAITCGAFSPDGRLLFTGDFNGKGIVWDVRTKRQLHFLYHTAPIQRAVFTPDGRRVITADMSGYVHIWNALTGRILRTMRAHDRLISGLSVSDDNTLLVSAGTDGIVNVWRALPTTSAPPAPPELAADETTGVSGGKR